MAKRLIFSEFSLNWRQGILFVCDTHWQWEINHTGPRSSADGREHRANYLYPWKLTLDATDLTVAENLSK